MISGGSYANMMAFNAARIKKFPESKMKGITGLPTLAVFTSDQAHYCAKKNSAILGYGQDNCIGVKCDENGKMIPSELDKAIVAAKEKVMLVIDSTNTIYLNGNAVISVLGLYTLSIQYLMHSTAL